MTRGGKREGSGRPLKNANGVRHTLTCRVKESNRLWLYQEKERTGKGVGDLVDLAVEVLQKHPEELPADKQEEP